MPNIDLFIIALIIGLLGGAGMSAIVATARKMQNMSKQIANLEANYGHTAVGRAVRDAVETTQFPMAKILQDGLKVKEQIRNIELLHQLQMQTIEETFKQMQSITNPNGGKS